VNEEHPPTTAPVSVIVTVKNEELTIIDLLNALTHQTILPEEVVIVDAASTDRTVELITQYAQQLKSEHSPIKLVVESFPCNRSQGRNQAIILAKNELIAITDAGCIPEPVWLEALLSAFHPGEVVGGYAIGAGKTPFERAVTPYFLPMPDRIHPDTYLPTTRSVLFEKKTWEKLGKFDERLNTSEDFALFHKMRQEHVPIVLERRATVRWTPPSSLGQFVKLTSTFATSDIQARILRPKVIVLFGRYLLGILLIVGLAVFWSPQIALLIFSAGCILYMLWAIRKHYWDVEGAWYWLPVLQLVVDGSVMWGTGRGVLQALFGVER